MSRQPLQSQRPPRAPLSQDDIANTPLPEIASGFYDYEQFKDVLEQMTEEDLADLKLIVEENLTAVKSQLQEARVKAATTGKYSDQDWYRRADRIRTIYGHRVTAIQNEQSARKRVRREAYAEANPDGGKHALFLACKELLSSDMFDAIQTRAREIADMKIGKK